MNLEAHANENFHIEVYSYWKWYNSKIKKNINTKYDNNNILFGGIENQEN